MAFFAPAFAAFVTVVAAVVPPIAVPASPSDEQPPFPAPPGYLLPWSGGEIHSVTQGEETTLTHNLLAAYAFDFDLGYDTIVAARAGKVSMTRADSNIGGCSAEYAGAANYVVIDHGDGTSALYLHLAQDSVVVEPGQLVRQGDPIGISGETGVTCSDDGTAPGAHLHFQVQRTIANHYFTQSVPIAFDDISTNNGVPVEGRSYISGNYGYGQPQKIKLTPHRVPRPFNPTARPTDPTLLEAEHVEVLPPPDDAPPADAPAPDGAAPDAPLATEESPTPEPTRTPRPTWTPSPERPADTPVPAPTDTPVPEPSPTVAPPSPTAEATIAASMLTPSVTDTAEPAATLAAAPSPTTLIATATPPPAETTAPSATDTATASATPPP